MTTFPKYYLVDFDIYVKVYEDNNEVVAINQYGNNFPPAKALEGQPITQEEFSRAFKESSAS